MFYVVRSLSPYTEYEFYVIAVNNIGRGPPSSAASTTTGETGTYRNYYYDFFYIFYCLNFELNTKKTCFFLVICSLNSN